VKKRTLRTYTVFFEAVREGGFVATVPTLPGCHTQGVTLEDAERNVAEAIEAYIDSLKTHGEPVPEETKSFQGTVTVPV
jgi:predicted RNase H-like HicB family nuclease